MYYLKAIETMEITYGNSEGSGDLIIKRYFNSNWACNQVTRKSTDSIIFMLDGGLVSWCLSHQ